MRKIVINAPKGGVGKTTTATNIALLLARQNCKVIAVDLAGGLLMSRALSNTEEFSNNSQNLIRQLEGSPIPDSFPGATNFDYAVMDTDDSFVVSADLLRGTKAGWKVLVPVNPHDPIGLDRIPREIRAIITTTLLTPSDLKLSVFMNMAHGGDITEGAAKLQNALNTHGINSTLTSVHLPYAPSSSAPILLDQAAYRDSLDSLLREVSR